MDTMTTPEPTLRDLLERRLTAAEAARDEDLRAVEARHAKEIAKLETQLAAEDDVTPTEFRRRRRKERSEAKAAAEKAKEASAGTDETGLTDDPIPTKESPEARVQAWAREDDSPAKVIARIKDLLTRVDVELYGDALPTEHRKHADVQLALTKKLSGFAKARA